MKLELSKEAREKLVVAELAGRSVRTFVYMQGDDGRALLLGQFFGVEIPSPEDLMSASGTACYVSHDGKRFVPPEGVTAVVHVLTDTGLQPVEVVMLDLGRRPQ